MNAHGKEQPTIAQPINTDAFTNTGKITLLVPRGEAIHAS